MDIPRLLILMGLAVTAYMLVLAWNEDYGDRQSERNPAATELSGPEIATDSVPESIPRVSALPTEDSVGADEIPGGADIPGMPSAPVKADIAASDRLVTVSTDVLQLTIDLRGGDIVSGALPAFPQAISRPDEPIIIIDPRHQYSAQTGLIGADGTDSDGQRPLFEVTQRRYELGDEETLQVDLVLPALDGVGITKRFTLNRNDYLINIEYIINNSSQSIWQGAIFGQLKRDDQDPLMTDDVGLGLQSYTGGATFLPDTPYNKITFDDLEDERWQQQVTGGYMAMVQHYFVTAWIPAAEETHSYYARKLGQQAVYLFGFTTPAWTIPAGAVDRRAVQLYVGPKDQYRLADISEGLDLTVDYGFLWWLAQPLFYLLNIIHSVVQNWGIAIILLTVTVKMVLYPLSAASFRSMAKMKRLQPEMVRLKERYGDDRQQFTKATMDLYKKEGANPLGGCLPILLQMPVFLALYWTLMESVELRQAPFMLWIKDLSDMDPYFVLPILMGISMYLTTAMQPTPPDPMQAKVFKLMPVMFTFFFLWFPAGLVLYWLVNNILSVLQQWYVNRQLDKA